ncbi:ABC transporter permease [Actinopolymorpha alba]|uniref:ABC transporter permease n=1 Tax=Actinopolymorpha alba TaxID=533267 RepID=UPI00037F783A|nr:ABC-2 family transporter protein [Actinopolymorpha alba]
MMVYAAIASRTFRRYATYRAATAAGVFTNSVFGFIMAFTYIALWHARPQLGGYDVADAVTYVWLGQSLLAPAALFGGGFQDEFSERIRSGDVAIDLYRPVDLQSWWLASDLGRAAFQFLGRGILPTFFGALAFDLTLPPRPGTWLAFLCAVFLGVVVSFGIRYLVCLTAFWLMDSTGVQQVAGFCGMFFSGMVLPLTVFPGWLGDVSLLLPWAACLQVPVDVFLGKHEGVQLLQTLGFQAIWAVVLLLAGRALSSLATRKVVVQGG